MKKYGREAVERFQAPNNPLDTAGRRVGIEFNKNRRFINTLDCHRLMEYVNSETPETSDALMEKMFQAYFVEAKDLSNEEELRTVAISCGLEESKVAQILSGDKYRAEVLEYDELVKNRMRVSGVPFFIIQKEGSNARPVAFSGAQPADIISDQLVEVFESQVPKKLYLIINQTQILKTKYEGQRGYFPDSLNDSTCREYLKKDL